MERKGNKIIHTKSRDEIAWVGQKTIREYSLNFNGRLYQLYNY
jgi:hypothetical protein